MYAVLQNDYELINPNDYAEIYSNNLDIALFDAKTLISRQNGGLLADRLSEGHAEKLQGALQEAGLATTVLPMTDLLEVGRPELINKASLSPDGFSCSDMYERVQNFSWENLKVASLLVDPKHMGPNVAKTLMLDLVFDCGKRFRISASSFNYSYLEERPRKR